MHKRTLPLTGILSGLAIFAALSATPSTVLAQETPTTTPSSVVQDTTIPEEIKPLFKGINLTPDQSRQVAAIYQRHSGMGAGAGMADSLPARADSARAGASAHQELMFKEIRALLTSADQSLFDQNVAAWKAKGHEKDPASWGGQRDSTGKWNKPSSDSTHKKQPTSTGPKR